MGQRLRRVSVSTKIANMNRTNKALILMVALCLCCVSAVPSVFKDCGSAKANVQSVDISPCEGGSPCKLKKGSKTQISITYTPTEAVTKGTAVVHGKVGPIYVPFSLPDGDLCKFSTASSCPVAANTQTTYSNSLDILSVYPSIKVVVEWELKDANGNDLVCVMIPAEIVS